MSNHSGSYMLNGVLLLLEKYGFFAQLERQERKDFLIEIQGIGWSDDCNDGEIFDQLGEKLGFCYECQDLAEAFTGDRCNKCEGVFNSADLTDDQHEASSGGQLTQPPDNETKSTNSLNTSETAQQNDRLAQDVAVIAESAAIEAPDRSVISDPAGGLANPPHKYFLRSGSCCKGGCLG